jgi:ABC-2 type transport system permease protein
MKWRFQNPISVIFTILQPLLWLVLYSAVVDQTMKNMGINNYMAFILPGVIVLVTFSACCSGGMINFIMKSSGSFYRILIAPVNRSPIVLGQMLEAILLSFIEIAILCAIGIFFSVKVASYNIHDSIFFIRSCLFN